MAQMVKRLPTMWETWVQSRSQEDLLEKEMATHSSILAWRMAWTEEPGGPQFMGSQELDTTYSAIFSFFLLEELLKQKWQPTPVLLPGESHGGSSLVGYSPWGRKESNTTE